MDVLYGLHPVEEAIRSGSGRVDRISVARERSDRKLEQLAAMARAANIRVALEPREQLTRIAKTDMHQGVVAFLRERTFLTIEDLLERRNGGFFWRSTAWRTPTTLGR